MSIGKLFRRTFYLDHEKSNKNQETGNSVHLSLDQLDRTAVIDLFKDCGDVNVHSYFSVNEPGVPNPLLIYCDGMIDPKQLSDFLYIQLRKLLSHPTSGNPSPLAGIPLENQNIHQIVEPHAVDELIQQVLSGNLVLFFEQSRHIFAFQMASPPQRAPSESNTEISVKGPRDGFTEAVDTNVALIRKRLKTTTLGIEFDPNTAWDEREGIYKMSGKIVKTFNITQSAEGKNGLWTSVIACGILLP